MQKIDDDYRAGDFKEIDNIKFSTDKAIRLGQAMYETSIEVKDLHYRNLFVIYGIFSEICKERYDTDVSFEDFFRVQKIVREYSQKLQGVFKGALEKELSKIPDNGSKSYIK